MSEAQTLDGSFAAAKLRVLTGLHAGACLELPHELQQFVTVGPQADADVFIEDWEGPGIRLLRGADGGICFEAPADTAGDEPPASIVLRPLVPRQFGSIILCVGPAHGDWPCDAELLRTLFEPAPAAGPEPAGRKRRGRIVMVVTVMAMGVLAGGALLGNSQAKAPTPAAAARVSAADAARAALGRDWLSQLQLRELDGQLTVSGVLATRQDVQGATRALRAVSDAHPVRVQLISAEEVVERIREAVASGSVTVERIGPADFAVTAKEQPGQDIQRIVNLFNADMAHLGVRIAEVALTPAPTLQSSLGLLLDADGTHVARGPRGAKTIVISGAQDADPAAAGGRDPAVR